MRVLITGACGGLGGALARELAGRGADLLLVDRQSRKLDALSADIRAGGASEPGVCALDFIKAGPEQAAELASIVARHYGGLDTLVHCAARFSGLTPLDQMEPEEWFRTIHVNLHLPWLLTRDLLPALKRSAGGRIAFVLEGEKVLGQAYWGGYSVSKAALANLADILAEELDGTPVEVFKFCPPPMRTSLRAEAFPAENPNDLTDPKFVARELAELLAPQ